MKIVLKNSDNTKLNKNNLNTEHSYSKVSFLPTENIYANDSDFSTQSPVKSNEK